MRQPKQRRGRSRGPQQRRPGGGRNSSYDSSGPGMKIRGTASQVLEKYLNLAKEALTSGDRVTAENFFQHAEHYHRIVSADNESKPAQPNGGGSEQDSADPSQAPQPNVGGPETNAGGDQRDGQSGGQAGRNSGDGSEEGDKVNGDKPKRRARPPRSEARAPNGPDGGADAGPDAAGGQDGSGDGDAPKDESKGKASDTEPAPA